MKRGRIYPRHLRKLTDCVALGLSVLFLHVPAEVWCNQSPTAGGATVAAPSDWLSSLSFSNSDEPVFVKADRLEFQYESRVLIYQGSVEVRQGETTLVADQVRVFLSPGDRVTVREVRANGNVRVSQGTRWATAKEATFDQARRLAVLQGGAVLHDGRNEVRGDTVTVYLDERRSVIDGGKGRVQAVLYPGAMETPSLPFKGAP